MRKLFAAIAGIITAVVTVGAIQSLGHMIFPPPPDVNLSDPNQLAALIERMPPAALIFVVAAWLVGSFAGAVVATLIARRETIVPAMTVAAAVLFGALYSLFMISHPLWMAIAGIALPLPSAWLGATVVGIRRS